MATDVRDRMCLAFDVEDPQRDKRLLPGLAEHMGVIKFRTRPALKLTLAKMTELLRPYGTKLFWDPKLYNSVDDMVEQALLAKDCGVDMMTVHASVGPDDLSAVVKAVPKLKIIAVTVMTTVSESLAASLYRTTLTQKVWQLSVWAKEAKAAGIVCSAKDLPALHRQESSLRNFLTVTPAIRAQGSPRDDQVRTATAVEAGRNNSGMLVIGRPILGADKPHEAASTMAYEYAAGLEERQRHTVRY